MKIEFYDDTQEINPFFVGNLVDSEEVDTNQDILDEYVRFIMKMCLRGETDVEWNYDRDSDHDMNKERNVLIATMFANVQSKVGDFIKRNDIGLENARRESYSSYFISVDDMYEGFDVNMKFQVLAWKPFNPDVDGSPFIQHVSPITSAFKITA